MLREDRRLLVRSAMPSRQCSTSIRYRSVDSPEPLNMQPAMITSLSWIWATAYTSPSWKPSVSSRFLMIPPFQRSSDRELTHCTSTSPRVAQRHSASRTMNSQAARTPITFGRLGTFAPLCQRGMMFRSTESSPEIHHPANTRATGSFEPWKRTGQIANSSYINSLWHSQKKEMLMFINRFSLFVMRIRLVTHILIPFLVVTSVVLAACATKNELTPEVPTAIVTSASPNPSEDPLPVAAWNLDGDGTASVGDSGLEFSGAYEFSDTAVSFDGYTGSASTSAPGPIDTKASFSVSAWVNYVDKVSAFSVAICQLGEVTCPFALGVDDTSQWWFAMKR